MCESLLNNYELWRDTCSKKTICVSILKDSDKNPKRTLIIQKAEIELGHSVFYKNACAPGEYTNQPAQLCGLIRLRRALSG